MVALIGVHTAAGSVLMRRLDDDERVARVVLIDRFAPALPLRKAVFSAVDLTATLADGTLAEILARERVDTVVHGAFHDAPVRTVEAAHELEVLGTRALLRALAHNVRLGTTANLVVLGTTLSYGAHPDNPQYLAEDAPLRARRYPFVDDKVAVEHELAAFRARSGMATTMLRAAFTLGAPQTVLARLLTRPLVPAVLGHDPLMQLLHVEDLVDAAMLAIHGAYDGAFNVAARGVLPFSTIIKLSARLRAPGLETAVRAALDTMWTLGIGAVPGAHTAYLRDTCVGDVNRAEEILGFRPRYSTHDVVIRHIGAHRHARSAA